MKYLSKQGQLIKLRRENEQLKSDNEQLKADMDYLAMMTDVELDKSKEDEND